MIVTVYTAGPSCMACRQTKRHLEKRGIEFTEVQIDEFVTEAAKFLGLSTAPIVCVSAPSGELFWDGYRPDRIDALVASLSPSEGAVQITDRGAAVVESGLTVRQAHELRTGCRADDPCARCRADFGAP